MSLKNQGLQRLVKGSFEIGKYVGYASVLAGLGCFHAPNYMSISENGRYVAVPVNRNGEFKSDEENRFADVLVIDTKASIIKIPMRFYNGFNIEDSFYMTNSRNKIAYMNKDSEGGIEGSSVFVLSIEGSLVIKNAGFPRLFDNGHKLAYTKILNKNKLDIVLRDLKSGSEKSLGIEGIVSDFSSDAKHLAYLFEKKIGEESEDYLGICDIDGRNKKSICQPDFFGGLPQWIDNKRILFKMDSEVFVADNVGNLERITNNSFDEIYPQASGERIFFGIDEEDEMMPIYFAEEKNNEWKVEDTNIKTKDFFRVTGDNIIYINDENHILRRNIKELPVKGKPIGIGADDYSQRSKWRAFVESLNDLSQKVQNDAKK